MPIGLRKFLWAPACVLAVLWAFTSVSYSQTQDSHYQNALDAARASASAGQFEDAIKQYQAAIHLSDGHDYTPYWGLASAHYRLGETKEVLAACDRVIALSPGDRVIAQAHDLKGRALVLSAQDDKAALDQAEGEFRLAIVADPNLTLAHDDLADLLRKEHRDGEAASETNVNPPSDFNDSNRPKIGRRIIVDGNTGQEITDIVEAKTATEIRDVPERSAPQAAPRFKFVSAKGEHVSLDDLHGKIVLLDFWASWCPPCRASVPQLGEIYDEYPKDKFVLIGISLDENDGTWRQFTESHDERWVQVRDSNRQLSRLFFSFGRMALPTYFLVDGEGNVRLHISGWSDSMGQRLDREIGRLIKELPASAAVEKPD